MQNLTPDQVFICTFCAAALSGLAVLLKSGNELTVRSVLSALLFYGSAGVGLGMISYDFLGGKQNPWRVIGCGWLVGLRVIKFSNITTIAQRLFNLSNDSKKDDDKKKQ